MTTPRPGPSVAEARPSNWNIANALTVARILLVPIFGWLLLADTGRVPSLRWAALACFVLAMITDRIDGDLARRRNLITDFGKVADPIADKALMTMALVGLSIIGAIPWWITIVVLAREWGVTAMRFVVIRHGVMAAGRGGKVKTMLQTLALGAFIMPRHAMPFTPALDVIAWVLLGAAVIVTVVTGMDYLAQALILRRTSERAVRKRAAAAAKRDSRRGRRGGQAGS